MKKIALFVFRGDPLCFIHVMLNSLDMASKGYDVKVILEGESVKLVEQMQTSGNKLFAQMEAQGLIDAVCQACSAKMGVLEYNQKSGLRMADEMSSHPAMATYIDQGYSIITQ